MHRWVCDLMKLFCFSLPVCPFLVTRVIISGHLLTSEYSIAKIAKQASKHAKTYRTYLPTDTVNTMSNNDQPASSVPNPMAAPGPNPAPAAAPAAAVENNKPAPTPAPPASAAKPPTPQQQALQQQIQAQLQAQLQQQLQAAAAKGKQANITPEMIQVRSFVFAFDFNYS